jgi:hypothetical protein
MGYIYTITNKTDNKTYVGQTVQDVEMRWKDHLKRGSNCRYLKSAFNKYGVDNFVFKLVCITFDNQLNDMEIQYIEKYNCLVPNGYNLRLGGNSGRHNAETKQKISESLKKRYDSGNSDESLKRGIITRRKNKIIQFDVEGNRLNSFDSCKEAGEYIGTLHSNISACCSGKTKTSKGYVWKYEPIIK